MAPRIFCFFYIIILIKSFRYETIETHARAFFIVIIFFIAGVPLEHLLFRWIVLRGSDLAPIYGDLNQSEKLSEIKPYL